MFEDRNGGVRPRRLGAVRPRAKVTPSRIVKMWTREELRSQDRAAARSIAETQENRPLLSVGLNPSHTPLYPPDREPTSRLTQSFDRFLNGACV